MTLLSLYRLEVPFWVLPRFFLALQLKLVKLVKISVVVELVRKIHKANPPGLVAMAALE
jgi:hypothetical protein